MTLSKVVIELRVSDFCRRLSLVAISRMRALNDIAFPTRIGQKLKKLGGLDKVKPDLDRRQHPEMEDAVNIEEIVYNFND